MRVSLDNSAGLHGHQVLAASVIKQALNDLEDGSPDVVHEARLFLLGSRGLRFWCDVAGLEVGPVVAYARSRLRPERRADVA